MKLINEIARKYYQKQIKNGYDIDLKICPEPITKEMLSDELMTGDLHLYIKTVDKDYLWNQYLYINTISTNKYGFVDIPFQDKEKSISVKRSSESKVKAKGRTITKSKSKVNTINVIIPKGTRSKSKTYNNIRNPTPYTKRTSNKRRSHTYSGMVGGENKVRMRTIVEGLNGGVHPHWSSGLSTIVKITNINDKPIYARGTSLPIPDDPSSAGSVISPSQYCTNTLNFYRYIKQIPNLISLQGCDLDWNEYQARRKTRAGIIYTPKYCDNLHEKDIWNKICNEYDNHTSLSQKRTDYMKEYYWVDMSAGFFSVYKSLSDIDFTDISNSSIIHCLAGFGRTGTVLLLIICINYYKEFPGEYETDFLTLENNDPNNSKTSYRIIRKLKKLFHDYLTLDQEIPIDPDIPINDRTKDTLKRMIASFGIDKIFDELFTNFYRRGARNRQVSYTSLNVLVTRINYILYFTAKACGHEDVILYETHQPTATSVGNPFDMDSLVLRNPELLQVVNVNVMVKNPIVQELAIEELTKRGFDFVFFTRTTHSSNQRTPRRGNSGNQNNIPSLITSELVPIERLTPSQKSKKNKTPRCVIS